MSRPKQRQSIADFSGGLVTFPSPLDMRENQFVEIKEVDNQKVGRLEKVKGPKSDTAAKSGTNNISKGQGFHTYRTEYNLGGTSASTYWYVLYRENGTSDQTIIRTTSGGGAWATGGSALEEILDETTWTSTGAKLIDIFDHNQVLRISDGQFVANANNKSQWYGYINRNILGQGLTYGSSGKFKAPGSATAIGGWNTIPTALTPPTIVSMGKAFDRDEEVESANEVGIHITQPDTADALLVERDSETVKNGDKYTCTFVYDYVQESALGKSGDQIGVRSLTAVQNLGKRVPGIQMLFCTTSLNKRITGINLYWNPEGDVDWYLVAHLDILNGWSDDSKALEVSSKYQAGSTGENMGFWLPVPDWTNVRTEMTLTGGTAGRWDDSTGSWTSKGYVANDIVVASADSGEAHVGQFDTLVASISSINTGGGNTQATLHQNAIDFTDTEDSTPATKYVVGGPSDSTKAATWYIPNDGFKGYTYQSFTGRHAGQRIPAIRWQASAEIADRAFYGNVDTEDENEQTVRERSRVYYTPIFRLDEISPANYKDFGRNDGDIIMSLEELDGRLYILKENNVYIYNTQSGNELNWFIERHYRGPGSKNNYSSTRTPYGIVCGNITQVSLVTPEEVIELSFPIRATYRALDFDGFSMTYSPVKNELIVLTDADGGSFFIYNFDFRSWTKESHESTQNKTNLRLGPNQKVVYGNGSTETIRELDDASTDSTATATIKTKQFDFGAPDVKKRFTRLYITYKTDDEGADAMTVRCYLDGSGSSSKDITFAAKASLTNVGDFINLVGKTLTLQLECAGQDFILDEIIFEYTIMGHTP